MPVTERRHLPPRGSMSREGVEFQPARDDSVVDTALRTERDQRNDVRDRRVSIRSCDRDFVPFRGIRGEEGVGVRKRRRGAGGRESDGTMEAGMGGVKRARVGCLGEDEAEESVESRGIEVRGEVEVRIGVDGRIPAMSMDLVNGNGIVDLVRVGESIRGSGDGAELGLGLGLSADGTKGKGAINIDSDDKTVKKVNKGKFSESGKESGLKGDFGIELKLVTMDVGALGDDWPSIATGNRTGGGDLQGKNQISWHEILGVVNEQLEECFWPDVNGIHLWEPKEFFSPQAVAAILLPALKPRKEPPTVNQRKVQDRALSRAKMQAYREQGLLLEHRISQAACDLRKVDSHLLEILVSDSPTEVYRG